MIDILIIEPRNNCRHFLASSLLLPLLSIFPYIKYTGYSIND